MTTGVVFEDPPGLWRSLWRASGPMRGALVAGAVAGVISAGVGARIVMRVIALTNSSRDGVTTDAEATVGRITAGGTASILMLGVIAGVMGGAVYLGLRRWLPVPAAWNGVAFGIVSLLTVGNLLFDAGDADFQIFEPVLMVLALFSALFFLNGLILGRVLDRIHPEPPYPSSVRVSRAVSGVMAIVCAIGAFGLIGSTVEMLDEEGTCYSAAGGGNGCAVRIEDIMP